MFPELPKFVYTANQRDPFVSPSVTFPYVTDEEVVPEDFDAEKYNFAMNSFKNSIKSKIKVQGVNEGTQGLSYGIINDEIYHTGEDIPVPLDEGAAGAITEAAALALESGKGLPISEDQASFTVLFLSVKGKKLLFKLKGTKEEIEVAYEKEFDLKPKSEIDVQLPPPPEGVYKPSTATATGA